MLTISENCINCVGFIRLAIGKGKIVQTIHLKRQNFFFFLMVV